MIRLKDTKGRNSLIENNLRLIYVFLGGLSMSYWKMLGVEEEDLKGELFLTLLKVAENWNPKKGKFSTYAFTAFESVLARSVDESRLIHYDWEPRELFVKLQKSQQELKRKLGRKPTPRELAKEMGITPKKVEKMLQMQRAVVSLDVPLSSDSDETLLDTLPSSSITMEEEVVQREYVEWRAKVIQEGLNQLSDRERFVVSRYYGLDGAEPSTLQEVGHLLAQRENKKKDFSRERIRQIRNKGLMKLKRYIQGKYVFLCKPHF